MSVGNVARVVAVLAAVVAAAGSATSGSNDNKSMMQQQGQNQTPPPPQQMEAARALGLWRSTFGGVKIEADDSKGGINTGAVQGVWVYKRAGAEVIGYFSGSLRGNVLDFRWQEPNNPPLTGAGYLVFDPQGRQYSGRWWSDRKDRIGDWNGWRQGATQGGDQYQQPQPPTQGGFGAQAYGGGSPYGAASPYGGAAYGYQQQPPPQQRSPYYQPQQRQPQPYYPPRQPQPRQPAPYYPPQQPQPGQPYYPQQQQPTSPPPSQQPYPYE
ncbi:MAG: hypothetical protein ABI175_25950 [Polyangiales bacterium]